MSSKNTIVCLAAAAAIPWISPSFAEQDLGLIGQLHEPLAEHCEQEEINAIADANERFKFSFECGRRLFDTRFNALDGGGGNVGDGGRYSGVPRADLDGPGEWANHFPARRSGPDGEACSICHIDPLTGSGAAALNIILDPLSSGELGQFIQRNTTSMLGAGPIQLLAEEMTARLQATRDRARATACATQQPQSTPLTAKRVSFGIAVVACNPDQDDNSQITGIESDLIVRPFGWKGVQSNLRAFNRGAGHNDIGVQAEELVGEGVDGDFDGVANELLVGDMTGLSIYLASQPRPVTRLELANLGLLEELGQEPLLRPERRSIIRGRSAFNDIGCTACHKPALRLNNTVYSEPSANVAHRDEIFPSGLDPVGAGVNPLSPVSFDVAKDVIDNQFVVNGRTVGLGNIETNNRGRGVVRLYGDLKRHDMGPELAEPVDDLGVEGSVWLTKELWGIGSTGPYLHDGRATTLSEAIVAHGGEGEDSRNNFASLPVESQTDVITFLNNLLLVRVEAD